MLKVVKGAKAQLAIAIASWTGVDKGELEATRWEDFRGGDLLRPAEDLVRQREAAKNGITSRTHPGHPAPQQDAAAVP